MIHDWFEWTVNKLFFRPLYKLYTLVWWHDHSDTHICTALSPGTSSRFWEDHTSECQDMIHTQFQGIYTVISCGLWLFCLYQLYLILWHKCIIARTQRSIMRDAFRTAIQDVRAAGWTPNSNVQSIRSERRETPPLQLADKATSTDSPISSSKSTGAL